MTKELTRREVASYLNSHPDFFVEHDNLLLKMELPHKAKGTISLVEKQVDIMRERQKKAKKQLNEFVASAKRNKEIFDISRNLILDLISANRRLIEDTLLRVKKIELSSKSNTLEINL